MHPMPGTCSAPRHPSCHALTLRDRLPRVKRLDRAIAMTCVAASAAALSACSFFSPQTTEKPYNPSEGVAADLGPGAARNLFIVAEKAGGPGPLTGAVVNTGTSSVSVGFENKDGAAGGTKLSVGAREIATIKDVTFDKVATAPGTMTEIYLVTPEGKKLVTVPIVAAVGIYKDLAPKS